MEDEKQYYDLEVACFSLYRLCVVGFWAFGIWLAATKGVLQGCKWVR